MNNPKIETDLAQILLEIKSDIKSLDSKVEQRFNKVDERLNKIEIGQADLKGDIKALDTKTEQLDKRISNVEFAVRGVFIGLLVLILGGFAMFFLDGK